MQTLRKLNERFGGLFTRKAGGTDDEGSDNDEGNTTYGFRRWGWVITLDNISGEDPTKWPYYYDLNVIEFLTICSYYKDKAEEKERQLEVQRLKRKYG